MRRTKVIVAVTVIAVAAGGSAAWVALRPGGQGVVDDSATTVVPIAAPVHREPPPVLADMAWGASVIDYARALAAARALPLEVAAGQVIVATISNPDPASAASVVGSEHLAGVILMGGAITDAAQVEALAVAVQEAAAAADGRSWPAIVSTDQEGGPVSRLSGILPSLPAFMAAGSIPDKGAVARTFEAAGRDMRALGVNVDWAPDGDVTVGVADPTIRVRSAGSDPVRVGETVVAAVQGLASGGVIPAIKHFPGHGSVTTDSHEAVPTQTATVAQLETTDFVPFAAAIKNGVPVIMMGHIVVPEWGGLPATVSPQAYAYLRQSLGFTGVSVTDALDMRAITDGYAPGDSEVAALAAGADLLLSPRDPAAARQAIVAAVGSGTLPRHRLDEAVARVSLLMTLQERRAAVSDAGPIDPQAGADYARTFAAAATTVSAASCTGPYVGSSVTITGGWEGERRALTDALASYGITTGGGTTVQLLGSATGTGQADVVVALDGPWGLPESTASVYVGLYGRSDAALAGLADVLAGAVTPTGQWAVEGMPPACGAP